MIRSGVRVRMGYLGIVLATVACNGTASRVASVPHPDAPLVVLMEHESWVNRSDQEVPHFLIGAESPRFALYEDGTVIYQVRGTMPPAYATVRLDRDELASLMETVSPDELWSLEDRYSISACTDQTTSRIFIWTPRGRKCVSVYGVLRLPEVWWLPDDPEGYEYELRELSDLIKEGRGRLPVEFLRAYDVMLGYENPRAVPWLPERIEVLAQWSGGPAVPWPAEWPPPASGEQLPDDLRRVFIPPDQLPRLREFLRAEQCFTIQGDTWALDYRIPFPGEDKWME